MLTLTILIATVGFGSCRPNREAYSTVLGDFFDRIPQNEIRKASVCDDASLSCRLRSRFWGAGSAAAQTAATPAAPRRWKGRPDSKVKRWDVITVGNLSRKPLLGRAEYRGSALGALHDHAYRWRRLRAASSIRR